VRERRPTLGAAAEAAEVVEAAAPLVTIRIPESSALFVEPLKEIVEEILSQVLGQPVRLRVVAGTAAGPVAPAPPKRISDASIRADRLKSLRARDPALDLAADALDLEIVE
jgi:hypothetical protein